MEWKHFPGYWPFVRGIHRSPVNSPHKGQWRFDVYFDPRPNKRLNKHDLRPHRAHYDITVMWKYIRYVTTKYIDIAPFKSV